MSEQNRLTPKEVTIIQMALQTMIEDNVSVSTNPTIPFTPETRKDMREMLDCAKSALAKIAATSGHLVQLDPYNEGDEKEFMTKQS